MKTSCGTPLPLGCTIMPDGVNFSLFCRHGRSVWLLLFKPGSKTPLARISLDTVANRTGDIWHLRLHDIDHDLEYGYQVSGPNDPKGSGHLFNHRRLLLDPYARALCGGEKWGVPASRHGRSPAQPYRCLIIDDHFDWQGDRPLNIPMQDSIIYELHVRGFTNHPSSKVRHPGTYQGIIEKIPYLKELGVTAVELMPVTEFNENENTFMNPENGQRLKNFWGYSPVAFFAPKAAYAVNGFAGNQVREFKTMVRELHKAGIEVILDIVFNHTAEGGADGPVFSFRGLDNTIYYLLDRQSRDYLNFSGCGNTFNCNHPLVRNFIMDCLRYWVVEMHVDGFRFDLASILGRDQNGEVLSNPPMVEQIAEDPLLSDTKIIAEAWDAAGLYQVGQFSSHVRWAEWNGRFRDDVRGFNRGDPDSVAAVATRIAGSSDLYQHSCRRPFNSINFITSHDGFTLLDLVSFNHKHNLANGEKNRDGDNHNLSWNSGAEGSTRSRRIREIRSRRMRSLAVILFLSQGTPMLAAGDEFCRTQQGNNNAYCQDNEISWLDWRLARKNKGMLRFFQMLIHIRRNHPVFRREEFFTYSDKPGRQEVIWQSLKVGEQDWSPDCRTLAFFLNGKGAGDDDFFVMLNAHQQAKTFEVPKPARGRRWLRLIDSGAASPEDIISEEKAEPIRGKKQAVAGMGAVVLIGKRNK